MKKKVVIIDDEPLARSIVMEYLAAYTDLTVVAECNDGFEGLKKITEHQPELIFLDVQMPKINGFELLELLPSVPNVIFTTAFDEYAIKAFESNAIDYLLKPFSQERFDCAIKKWTEKSGTAKQELDQLVQSNSIRQPEERNRVVVKKGAAIRIVPVDDICYLEAYDDYVKIITKDDEYIKKKTMNYYEEVLDGAVFFRTHRSFIINLNQLTKIEVLEKNSYVAILRSGATVPISRSNYSGLKEKLGI